MTIADITEACGFEYYSQFCAVFKKKIGKSPAEYRALSTPSKPKEWATDAFYLYACRPERTQTLSVETDIFLPFSDLSKETTFNHLKYKYLKKQDIMVCFQENTDLIYFYWSTCSKDSLPSDIISSRHTVFPIIFRNQFFDFTE